MSVLARCLRSELLLLLFYVAYWFDPARFNAYGVEPDTAISNFPLFEFIFAHSSTALLGLILAQKKALLKGGNPLLRVLLPWLLIYGLFFYVFLSHPQSRWIAVAYLYGVVLRAYEAREYAIAGLLLMHQVVRLTLFMVTVGVLSLPFVPVLGATPEAVGLAPDSSFAQDPHLAFGWIVSFYLLVYLYEVFAAPRLAASPIGRLFDGG